VKHLGLEAISHNWNMTSLTIPASVKTIEELCFWGNDLSYIIFEGDMPELSSNEEEGEGSQFWDNAEDFTIYYHAGAEGWADYDLYPTVAMAPTDRGDVDGDNMTTEKDLAILTQFFAGYAHVIDEDKLDIDGEDGLTRKDIMILNRYLAGWEDYDRYFTE